MRKSMALLAVAPLLIGWSVSAAQGQARSSPVAAAERFVVSGVILLEREGGLAWMQEPSLTGGRVVAVRVSESIGPYRVTRILEDRVELEGPAGMVMVPVYNAQATPGVAVAQAGGDVAGSGASATGRPARGDGLQEASAGAQPGMAQPPATSAVRALMDRLNAARQTVEQAKGDPQAAQLRRGAATSARTPSASGSNPVSPGNPGVSSGGPAAPAGSPGVPAGNSGAPAGNANVVYPPRQQTFQSILGLK